MIGTLWSQQFRGAGRFFRHKSWARSITVLAFILLITSLATGIYFLFLEAFRYVANLPFAAPASLYIYELMFLTLLGLMFASALISGMVRLFQGRSDAVIMASPVFSSLASYVGLTIFLSSLWPLIVIGLPALLAMNATFHLNVISLVLSLAVLVILGVFAVALSLAYLLLVTALMQRAGIKRLSAGLVIAILCAFAIGASVFWSELRTVSNVAALFPGIDSGVGEVRSDAIISDFQFLPSHPAAEVFFNAQTGDVTQAAESVVEVAALAAIGLLLFAWASRAYLPLWQAMQEHSFRKLAAARNRTSWSFSSSSPVAVLFQKEWLTFFRDQKNLLWLGFLGLLWLLQIGFDVIVKRELITYGAGFSHLATSIQLLQVVVIAYFISMFVLRFVFPAFSIERDTAWLIASIPVALERLYIAKYAFYAAFFIGVSFIVVALHSLILGLTLAAAALLFLLIACMTALIVLFGLSLGVIFPDFETNDAEELSTSLPGLVFIASSLVYGFLGALSYGAFIAGSATSLGFFIALSLCGGVACFLLSLRALRRFEFAR